MEPDSFLQPDGTALPFNDARYSGLSAGVPGTVAAWDAALRRYGSGNFRRALAPAIDVARKGFVVDATFASQITPNIPWFDDIPSTAALYLDPDGTAKRSRRGPAQPGHGPCVRAHRPPRRARGLLPRADRGGDGRRGAGPAARATADKTWRPGLLTAGDLER